jgi:hypothetical protein
MADFEIERYHGDTLVLPVTISDTSVNPSGETEYTPRPITGAAIKFKMGPVTESSEGYSIVRDDAAGTFCITISAALMESLVLPAYNFSVEIVYESGIKETLFVGKLTLKEDEVP